MRGSASRGTAAYFAAQAAAVLAWWLWLWLQPAARRWFAVDDWPPTVLLAFALPDLVLLVLGGAVASVGAARGRSWTQGAIRIQLGAVGYATLFCLGASFATGSGWLASGLMLGSCIGTVLAAQAHRR